MKHDERGQITVLTIGLFVIVGVLVVVVINASDAFVERQRLNALADSAAITAADALDLEAFYSTGELILDPAQARQRVSDHVSGHAGVRVTEVRLEGDTVTVRLEREILLPLTPPGLSRTATIVSESSGQLRPGGT